MIKATMKTFRFKGGKNERYCVNSLYNLCVIGEGFKFGVVV